MIFVQTKTNIKIKQFTMSSTTKLATNCLKAQFNLKISAENIKILEKTTIKHNKTTNKPKKKNPQNPKIFVIKTFICHQTNKIKYAVQREKWYMKHQKTYFGCKTLYLFWLAHNKIYCRSNDTEKYFTNIASIFVIFSAFCWYIFWHFCCAILGFPFKKLKHWNAAKSSKNREHSIFNGYLHLLHIWWSFRYIQMNWNFAVCGRDYYCQRFLHAFGFSNSMALKVGFDELKILPIENKQKWHKPFWRSKITKLSFHSIPINIQRKSKKRRFKCNYPSNFIAL